MRMHKTRLLTLLLFLLCVAKLTFADKVTVSTVTLAPGGAQGYFTVSLEGSTAYTAYQMDISLPDGVEIASADGQPMIFMANDAYSIDGKDIYPFTSSTNAFTGVVTKTYTHAFKFESQTDGAMRVICYSSESKPLTATSGALFHVFVKASPYAKPGADEVALNNVRFSTPAAVETRFDDTDATAITVAGECSLPVNISADNRFGTCVLPFAATLPEGLEAYSCSTCSGDALLLTPATGIEAYVPYIVYAPAGFSGILSGTPTEADYTARVSDGQATSGYLTAALKQTELVADESGQTYYVLQRKADTEAPMFYRVGTTSYILPEGKCFLTLPQAVATAATLRLGGANGLPIVTTDELPNSPIYNLQGQQVPHAEPGQIYIQNGRKMLKNINH